MRGSRRRLRSFVVEAYAPALGHDAAEVIAGRLREEVAALQLRGLVITIEAEHVLPDDELVFYVLRAETREAVELALAEASITFARIAESIRIPRGRELPRTGRAGRRAAPTGRG